MFIDHFGIPCLQFPVYSNCPFLYFHFLINLKVLLKYIFDSDGLNESLHMPSTLLLVTSISLVSLIVQKLIIVNIVQFISLFLYSCAFVSCWINTSVWFCYVVRQDPKPCSFFSKFVLVILGFLHFNINYGINFLGSRKNLIVILIKILLNLYIASRKIIYFDIKISYPFAISPHLYRLSLMSLKMFSVFS